MKALTLTVCAVLTLLGCVFKANAQRQNTEIKKYEIVVYISDIDGNAVANIVISSKGRGSPSNPSDGTGRTTLILQGKVNPGEELDLTLPVDVKENEDWEIIPHYRPQIPVLSHPYVSNSNAHATLILRQKKSPKSQPQGDLVEKEQLQSELADVYARFGHSEFAQEHYDEAFVAFKAALDKRPDHDENLYYAALSLLNLRRYEEVLSYIERCLGIRNHKPESIELALTHELYAIALSGLGRPQEAERETGLARLVRGRLAKQSNEK